MEVIVPQKPFLLLMYGFPGSGKTYFSRQFTEGVQAAHLEEDRVRHELFESPRYTAQENHALGRIMEYMAGEFLKAGISVVYDTNAMRFAQRRALREIARKQKATVLIVWFQLDAETSFSRNQKRDRRHLDDRFAGGYDVQQFKELTSRMQHPQPTEDFIVISGKHSFPSQMSSVLKKLADMQVVRQTDISHKMIKPELINLVPSALSKNGGKSGKQSIVLR